MGDRGLLYATCLLRSAATGMVGVLLGLYLAELGSDPTRIGLVVALGLAAGAGATLLGMVAGDRFGRRRFLLALAVVGALGGGLLAVVPGAGLAAAAAFLGMVNGMGRDRGPSLVIEQAVLASTVDDEGRTRAFAWYHVFQDAGHAAGGLLATLPAILRSGAGLGSLASFRVSMGAYAVLLLLMGILYLRLSPAVELAEPPRTLTVSASSRPIVTRICALFALDSLGGGFLTSALLALFFHERFGVGEAALGPLFFGARVANAGSHLAAAWLARRIGLVNTMVFTHIPSSLLLLTLGWAPSFPVAAALFLLREGLVEMDVPTRQSYVMAVVRPEERTFTSGATYLVRLGGWAAAPALGGLFMQGVSLAAPLAAAAGLKIAYDLLLYASFRGIRPPEEGGARS